MGSSSKLQHHHHNYIVFTVPSSAHTLVFRNVDAYASWLLCTEPLIHRSIDCLFSCSSASCIIEPLIKTTVHTTLLRNFVLGDPNSILYSTVTSIDYRCSSHLVTSLCLSLSPHLVTLVPCLWLPLPHIVYIASHRIASHRIASHRIASRIRLIILNHATLRRHE